MSGETQLRPGRVTWLHAYVGTVAMAAILLTVVTASLESTTPHRHVLWVQTALFALLLLIGETRSNWFRFGDGGEVSPGWAFAFAIVLSGSPTVAIAAIAVCTLLADLRERKSPMKVIFNSAQVAASLAAGALVLWTFGIREAITQQGSISPWAGLGILLGGMVVFVTNGLLTCIVLAVYHHTTVRSMAGRDFILSISADGALLALSPIFVVAASYSLLMLPLLAATALLVYQSTQQALERAHEASHDGLTRLLNRRAFGIHLDGFMASQEHNGSRGAILLIDLDGFKEINDRLGHTAGDRLLQGVADQINLVTPSGSVASRLGGDEFAILVPAVGDDRAVTAMAKELRLQLMQPIDVDGFPLSVGLSIGIAFAPEHGQTLEELLGCADMAMYRAKHYRTGVELYQSFRVRPERGRLGLLSDLAKALTTDQLTIHYQPQVRFASGVTDAVEALLRWQHPTLGNVPPGDFISFAEHTELIGPLTEFVLARAAQDAMTIDGHELRLAVNISARNLQDRRFPASVIRQLEVAGLAPNRLELEITESAIASEPERSRFAIDALRDAGIRIAIDDFGTGYSSFAMLRDLTVDRLKIDRSFVSGLATAQRQRHLVSAIVSLADALGLETLGEGVETEDDWAVLAALGCDVGQGYLIARPQPLASFRTWMEMRTRSALEVLSA